LTLSQTATPLQVVKRDGRVVPFDRSRIVRAIERCELETHPEILRWVLSENIAAVISYVDNKLPSRGRVSVESIQDLVERGLLAAGLRDSARAYMAYRDEHAARRIPEDVRAAFAESNVYFPTALQQFQFYDKYSRFNYELGRRETWVETVDRAVAFLHELASPYADLGAATYERIRRGILEMRVMPSMRLLAMAGEPARRNHISVFNCAFAGIDSIDAMVESLVISMAGCGFGYSVERKYVDRLPTVKPQRGVTGHFLVEDSTEGWAATLRKGLEYWFNGYDAEFDTSLVRPAGSVLVTKGGRASGPEPLEKLLAFCRARILSRQGKKLRPLDAHDMVCAIGQGVVSGGVRRTALISLFDEDDEAMLHCKDGDFERENSQRWNANNSAVTALDDPILFLERFTSMLKAGRGEPGIFNPAAALATMPSRRAIGPDFGTNPCGEIVLRNMQFCVSGNTQLITRDGIVSISEAVGREIEIWNGRRWATVTPFQTGRERQLLRVRFSDGSYLDCTPEHRFSVKGNGWKTGYREVQAKDLMGLISGRKAVHVEPTTIAHDDGEELEAQDVYELGFAIGDGCVGRYSTRDVVFLDLYGIKQDLPLRGRREGTIQPKGYNVTKTRVISESLDPAQVMALKQSADALDVAFGWSRSTILAFLAGWLDADGSVTSSGGVRLYLTGEERARRLQLLLTKVGIRSSVNLMQAAGAETNFGVRKDDMWYLQITDGREIPCHRLDVSRGHAPTMKGKYQTIREVVPLDGSWDTYCFEEPEEHKGVFGNVLTYQCNLSAAVVRADDDYEALREKVELATLIGTIQSLATDFKGLRPEWQRNCDEERLLGVDITGQQDHPALLTPRTFALLKNEAIVANLAYARALGVNRSAAITCVKPSGNTSQLVDCASGLHARWAPYYVRNVRLSASSPLARVLKDAGAPMSPENGDDPEHPRTYVVSFPVAAPEGAVTRNDRSAVEQCEWWLRNKTFWTEHNPSVTITYRPDEAVALAAWVWDHRDKIGGMAFLPAFDAKYDQLPYIEIDREEYERRVAAFPEIDFSKVYRYEASDMTTAAQELACSAGLCELP
jgi:hypothetical protein